jgi:hypothetical protein
MKVPLTPSERQEENILLPLIVKRRCNGLTEPALLAMGGYAINYVYEG